MKLHDAYASLEAKVATHPKDALAGLVTLSSAAPDFAPARFRIVDALMTLGELAAAEHVLHDLALLFAREGLPMQAIYACKLLESMGKDSDAVASEIALIYAGLTGNELVPTPKDMTLADAEAPAPAPADQAVPLALALAKHERPLPERFPALPLLSRLTVEDFVVVLRAMKLHRVASGARVIQQGATGASCFLLAEGSLAVSRQIGGEEKTLTRLHAGTIFGEMALVSRRPRNASITSLTGATLLELTKATMLTHSQAMREALYAFTRRRLLENITVTSSLFQPLARNARLDMISLFGSFPITPGQALITEGEAGQGLYVVLRGAVRVSKQKDGHDVQLATLHEGNLFGEISVLRDTPTTASVSGLEEGEVLFLDKGDFRALANKYPEVQTALATLTEERLKASDALLDQVHPDDALSMI